MDCIFIGYSKIPKTFDTRFIVIDFYGLIKISTVVTDANREIRRVFRIIRPDWIFPDRIGDVRKVTKTR